MTEKGRETSIDKRKKYYIDVFFLPDFEADKIVAAMNNENVEFVGISNHHETENGDLVCYAIYHFAEFELIHEH